MTARPTRIVVADLLAAALLPAVAIIGFGPTFDGPGYLVAGFGALAIGLALAWLGARFRWGVLTLSGATLAAYIVFGGALALPHTSAFGVVPTLQTLHDLAVGVVTCWKQLLTTVPPVAASDGHLLVPFIMALVAGVLTGSLALRASHPAWAVLPALAMLVGQILLGVATPAAPIAQGIVFAVVTVVWLAVRRAWDTERAAVRVEQAGITDADAVRSSRTRRLIAGAAVLAVAAGTGAVAAAAAPTAGRYILRDYVVPPFDITQYPSPLQSFRGIVRDDAETPLFTVTDLPEDARVRLATMDAYNGIVFNVADDGAGSSSAFTPARSNMSPAQQGPTTRIRFDIDGLTGVWLPDVGAAREFSFDGPRAADLTRSAHFNDATGTAVVPVGLASGDAYTLTTVIPEIPSDAALADVPFAPVKMPAATGVPEALSELASQAVGDAVSPIERVRALEAWLHTDGYFSHGLAGEVLSPSGHGASRISMLFSGDQMIGDDEQYAVAMALLATQLGIPARVVMGWHPDLDAETSAGDVFTATGDNLHAWVEVAFDGFGWLPFDPTPDEDNKPNEQTTKPRANPRPQVLQPPPPAQEPAELPPTIAEDRDQQDERQNGLDLLGPILLYGGIGLGVIVLLSAPLIVMGLIKGARRARRRSAARTADRISGGWDELVDSAVDLRTPVARGATRAESAAVVGSAFAQPRVTALADRADRDVYGPGDPTPQDVEVFWREVDDIVGQMRGSASRWQRLRARLSLRSLRRGSSRGRSRA